MEEWAEKQLSKQEAIKFFKGNKWKDLSLEEIFQIQFFQKALCLPFDLFHKATEKVLERSVWTHEFINHKGLFDEYLGKSNKPSMEDIINLIPKEKQIIIVSNEQSLDKEGRR